MIVYRISKSKFAEDLSGTGAAMFAARWNSVGTYMLYTSESSALSILENMVHYDLNELPNDLKLIRIIIPENIPVLK
ncbi:MAG: RES family NAD+ phosphorylase, partial [Ignavibacteria bacterium]|nr:RES family NAD+ phosphorylase [Ignavibacteria bacterium]